MDQLTKRIYKVFQVNGFYNTLILHCKHTHTMATLTIQLPAHKDTDDLLNLLPNIQETINATDYKIKQSGKVVQLVFGKLNIDGVKFSTNMINKNTLKLTLISSFGNQHIDFADGSSCHLLNGGTTRMGKTVFLLYLTTMMYTQTDGQCEIHITSSKIKDYYPFINVRNASLSKSPSDLNHTLNNLLTEYKTRDDYLNSPDLRKATDAKSVKELYPEHYSKFKPIFLIIDEYARFADNKEIQKKVQELVETAGYVNIHVIISSQRPDAKNVLNARIKANLLARVCFTTTDKNNSLIILDKEGAEKLGKIQGRAILFDSDYTTIQVPYITPEQCEVLLNPYKEETPNEPNKESKQGSADTNTPNPIQDTIQKPDSETDFFEQFQSNQRNEQSNETVINGWFRLASTTDKGSTLSIHSEPITHSSQKQHD